MRVFGFRKGAREQFVLDPGTPADSLKRRRSLML